jgi:hypothetical protein
VLPFTPQAFEKRTTRIERASPEWRPGALPSELRPRSDTPGWSRTSGLCRRRTALSPLSYERRKRSLRQESNPHLGRTKGACLPLTLRRQGGDGRSRTDIFLVASEVLVRLSYIPEVRTGGVEPPQHEATGLQPAELAVAQRPHGAKGWPAGLEPAPTGITTPGASVYTTATTKRGRPDSNRRPLA